MVLSTADSFLVWDESWKKFTQSDLSQDFSFGGHTSYTWHKLFVVTWYLCMHTLSDYRLDNQCYYRSKRPLQVPKHLITHPITSWSPWGFWVIYTIISALEKYKSWHLPAFHTKVKWHGSPSVTSCPSIRDVKGPGSFPSLPPCCLASVHKSAGLSTGWLREWINRLAPS